MSQKISDAGTQPKLSASKTAIWTLAAIALLLLPLFMMSSLTQAATDVSGDAFPIRQCSVRNRINKITNDEMVARFDGLNQSGNPDPAYFTGLGMKWVEYSDGSARLTGDMIAIGDPMNSGFTVDVTFSNRAIANGNLEYNSFYGTLTGSGGYAGAVVAVQPSVKAPSFRFWNNGPDGDGWIQWAVNSQSTGGQLLVEAGQSGIWAFSLSSDCKTIPASTYTPVPANGRIGNRVFKDNNLNGIQDADDYGILGIEVLLWTDDDDDGTPDNVIATQTTDADGLYQFQHLSIHVTYFVQFIIPADEKKLFTSQDIGSDDATDSDPERDTGIAGPINLAEGEKNDTVDAGLVNSPVSLGNRVWRDTNRNGVQDSGEPGEDGVTVYLLDGDKNILDSTVTANDGLYSFSNLNPKEVYRVRFEAPANTGFTNQDVGGNDGADSDPDPDTGQTSPISLAPGENNDDIDAGLVSLPGTLNGIVWKDDDHDGMIDQGEPALEGIIVNLLAKDGKVVATTETNEDGTYSFAGLDPTGEAIGIVWKDNDSDGRIDIGEPALEGITVNLLTEEGEVIATTETNADGTYSFPDVDTTIRYIVEVIAPDNKEFTDLGSDSDVASDTGRSELITIGPDGIAAVNAGLQNKPGIINGRVSVNGSIARNFLVELISEDKAEVVQTTRTDVDGHYSLTVDDPKAEYRVHFVSDIRLVESRLTEPFRIPANGSVDNVDADLLTSTPTPSPPTAKPTDCDGGGGCRRAMVHDDSYSSKPAFEQNVQATNISKLYIVEFELPADKLFTTAGGDSDVDPATGRSLFVVVPPDGVVDVSAGMVNKSSTLGDTVFKDDNENGIQDVGEGGVEDVTVRLLDKAGNEVATATTDANGNYSFSVDPKQSYVIEVIEPYAFDFSPQDASGSTDQNDSDVDPATGQTDIITIAVDDIDDTIDAGLIWETGIIFGRAWKDDNQNGIRDEDAPLDGITVRLWLAGASGSLIASTETNSNGEYVFFINPKLTYNVEFEIPDDKEATRPNVNLGGTRENPGIRDSDITAEGMTKETLYINPGSNLLYIDAGFVNKSASIGDRVWNDLNRNGIQEAGEPGEPGVTVELLAQDGSVVATTATDSDGNYLFADVDPKKDYTIRFTAPAGKGFTDPNVGSDDAVDSDAAPDGTTANITVEANEDDPTVDAGLVSLLGSISGTITKVDDPDGALDLAGITVQLQDKAGNELGTTVTGTDGYIFDGLEPGDDYVVVVLAPADMNFVSGNGTSGSLTVAPGAMTIFTQGLTNKPATIGDRVFQDTNQNGLQDGGESGIAGITVNLMDVGKSVLQTTTTDGDGLYSFTVDPKGGEYIIQFELPGDKEFSTPDVGADDAVDSDVTDPATGQTEPVTVGADETNLTVDAGMVNKGASVGNFVWRDLDNDGIQDAGEPGVAGVTVNLRLNDGTLVESTTTNAEGIYEFIDIDPKVGYEIEFVAPDGEEFTLPNVGTDDTLDNEAGPDGTTGTIDVGAGQTNSTVDAGLATIFDLALRKTVGEAEKLVLDGERVIFDIEVCNQGNVPAADILIVDYIPGAFVLDDAAWTQMGNQAELTITGPLVAGDCTTVEIGLVANFSFGVAENGAIRAASASAPTEIEIFEFVANRAEIVQTSDSAGNVRTSDVDSTYDRIELNDPIIENEIDLTPAEGDEDDHDKAIVQVLPRDLGRSGDVNADGARTAVDALFILRNDVEIATLPVSEPGRSGAGSQEELDEWCGTIGAFSHNGSTISGDFDGDSDCDGADYGDYVCDVSGDNQCNSIDALFILQCDVGLSNAFCAMP